MHPSPSAGHRTQQAYGCLQDRKHSRRGDRATNHQSFAWAHFLEVRTRRQSWVVNSLLSLATCSRTPAVQVRLTGTQPHTRTYVCMYRYTRISFGEADTAIRSKSKNANPVAWHRGSKRGCPIRRLPEISRLASHPREVRGVGTPALGRLERAVTCTQPFVSLYFVFDVWIPPDFGRRERSHPSGGIPHGRGRSLGGRVTQAGQGCTGGQGYTGGLQRVGAPRSATRRRLQLLTPDQLHIGPSGPIGKRRSPSSGE